MSRLTSLDVLMKDEDERDRFYRQAATSKTYRAVIARALERDIEDNVLEEERASTEDYTRLVAERKALRTLLKYFLAEEDSNDKTQRRRTRA